MSIDWQRETTMTLRQAAEALNRSVQQIHVWVKHGLKVDGAYVRLECIRIGTLHTSAEALQRFFERTGPQPQQPRPMTYTQRRRASEAAERRVRERLARPPG